MSAPTLTERLGHVAGLLRGGACHLSKPAAQALGEDIAAILDHAEALAGALFEVLGPNVSGNERFEIMAEQFYRETGIWAPGKDIPAACGASDDYPIRLAAWRDWNAARIDAARAILAGYADEAPRVAPEAQGGNL